MGPGYSWELTVNFTLWSLPHSRGVTDEFRSVPQNAKNFSVLSDLRA